MQKYTLAVIWLLFVAGVSSPAWAEPIRERLILAYEANEAPAVIRSVHGLQTSGLKVLSASREGGWVEIDVPGGEAGSLAAKLRSNPGVRYLVRNERLRTFILNPSTPPQPVTLRDQWSMRSLKTSEAWTAAGTRGRREVTVAVIDTGADLRHLALASNLVPGYNFVDNNTDPTDVIEYGFPGHGTHCSGVIAANGQHRNGTIGVAPEATIMPLKFISPDGGLVTDAIRAIDHAIANGVRVISASWGGGLTPDRAKPLIEAVGRAETAGVLFITAAGNDGKDNDVVNMYPANAGLSNMITVAAIDQSNRQPSWSNYSKVRVDIAAPGESVLSTLPGNRYATMSGTSMATPHIAGLAALLWSIDGGLTAQQIKALIMASGPAAPVAVACECRADAEAAVLRLLARTPTLVPQAADLTVGGAQAFEVWGAASAERWVWTSSQPAVLSVDGRGVATALSAGEAEISAQRGDGTAVKSRTVRVR